MSKFTPGPWEVHMHTHVDGEFWCSIGHNGFGPITDIVGEEGNHTKFFQPVAGMRHLVTPVDQQKANAFLIAAAPTLLKALKGLLMMVSARGGAFDTGPAIDNALAVVKLVEEEKD